MAKVSLGQIDDAITPVRLFVGCAVFSATIMIAGTCSMFDTEGPLPPPRPPPPSAESAAVSSYRYKEGFFKALVKEDSDKIKLKEFNFARVKAGNRHIIEFSGSQLIRPGGKLQTRHLSLEAIQKKIWVGDQGQGLRSGHLLLAIVNRTHHHLAYRVVTNVKGKCMGKGTVAHNAIALRPHQRQVRTECLLHPGGAIKVLEVEVMEISPVGYFYISRLDPTHLLTSRRTTVGHEIPARLNQCRLLPWRLIQTGMRRGDVKWADVIDFYSRHNCDEYSFFLGYRHSPNGPERLPVVPPKNKK